MNKIIAAFLLFLCALVAPAQEANCKLKTKDGTEISGTKIEYEAGKVKITLAAGGSQSFDTKQLVWVDMPKPSIISGCERGYYTKQYDTIISLKGAPSDPKEKETIEKYKYLGWGRLGNYFLVRAYIAKGQLDEADKALKLIRYLGVYTPDKLRDDQMMLAAEAELLVAQKKAADALKILSGLKEIDSEACKYLCAVRGDAYLANGEEQLAILEYYKVVLSFSPQDYERVNCLEKIRSLYQKNNDPRAADLDKLR